MFSLDLGNLLVHLGLDDRAFKQVFNTAEKRIKQAGEQLETMGRKMTMRVTMPLIGLGTAGVHTFAKFDEAMAKSLAIFGDVSVGMRKEMEATAKELSLGSESSAAELAKAYFYLGSAGFNAQQSLKALGAVEAFATAGSFDLSEATSLAADAQKALGMASKDPIENLENLRHVTDVLTGANTLADANIRQFSAALTNEAASAMRAWHIQLEEGVAVLAAYAEQNIKAEEAGSSFGRMLRMLMQGYRENTKYWRQFNIDIYDSNRNLRPLADIIEDLTNLLNSMSAETKGATLDLLGFQARSQQVIMPLLGMQDVIREFNARLNEMRGITDTVASRNLQNLASQLKITWNYVKGVLGDLGRVLAPEVLMISNAIRELSRRFYALGDDTKKFIVAQGLLLIKLGPGAWIVGKLTVALIGLKAALFGVVTAATAVHAAFIGVAVAAESALAGVWLYKNVEWIAKTATEVAADFMKMWESIKYGGKQAVAYLKIAWAGFKNWVLQRLADLEDAMASFLSRLETGIEAATGHFVSLGSGAAASAAEGLRFAGRSSMRELTTELSKNTATYIDNVQAIETATEVALQEIREKFQRTGQPPSTPDLDAVVTATEEAARKAREAYDKMMSGLGEDMPLNEAQRNLEKMLEDLDYEKQAVELTNKGWEHANDLVNFQRAAIEAYGQDGPEAIKKVQDAVDVYAAKLRELDELHKFDSLRAWLHDNSIERFWQNTSDVAVSGLDSFSDAFSEMMVKGKADWSGFTEALLQDWLRMIVRMQMAEIGKAVWPMLQQMGTSIVTAMAGGLGEIGNPAVKVHTGSYLGDTARLPKVFIPAATSVEKRIVAHRGAYLGAVNVPTIRMPVAPRLPVVAHGGMRLDAPYLPRVRMPEVLWRDAPVYHTGSNDEIAVWARKNEHILTAEQMDTLVGFADRGRAGGADDLLDAVREQTYWMRRQRIVAPVIVDRRDDVTTIARRNHLKRVDTLQRGG